MGAPVCCSLKSVLRFGLSLPRRYGLRTIGAKARCCTLTTTLLEVAGVLG